MGSMKKTSISIENIHFQLLQPKDVLFFAERIE